LAIASRAACSRPSEVDDGRVCLYAGELVETDSGAVGWRWMVPLTCDYAVGVGTEFHGVPSCAFAG